MPHYRRHGKIESPLTDKMFKEGMDQGHFVEPKHLGFIALLYYTGIRKSEALSSRKEQFRFTDKHILFDVGVRVKRGIQTPSLPLALDLEYVDEIQFCIEITRSGERVWPYCAKTGYNIVSRVFSYPHFFRLSRITNFFLAGWTIPQVRSWTGLTLNSLESYIGIVDIIKMGESLKNK